MLPNRQMSFTMVHFTTTKFSVSSSQVCYLHTTHHHHHPSAAEQAIARFLHAHRSSASVAASVAISPADISNS